MNELLSRFGNQKTLIGAIFLTWALRELNITPEDVKAYADSLMVLEVSLLGVIKVFEKSEPKEEL